MSYEIVKYPNGTASLKPISGREAMHSSIGPKTEAKLVYIEQSELLDKLSLNLDNPLVIFDVGLGVAANAIAAMEVGLTLKRRRKLRIISFENDRKGILTALSNLNFFDYLYPHQEKLKTLLTKKRWSSLDESIAWDLVEGDFLKIALPSGESPEIIFFDFYSPTENPELWGVTAFKKLYSSCLDRKKQNLPTQLLTYSASTSSRAALLLAGFHVGYGTRTEAKMETTIANTMLSEISNPLDVKWLKKLERSDKPLPQDWPISQRKEAFEIIRSSESFRNPL